MEYANSNQIFSVSNLTLSYQPSLPERERKEGANFCPLSFTKGKRLLRKTLANHVNPKFWRLIVEKGFFFCDETDCPIVYFSNEKQSYFGLDDLRSVVMHKMQINTENRPVCYCKNVLESVIMEELLVKQCCDSLIDIQNFTEANTGKDCAITNPTGRCCGKQVKEILEWANARRLDIAPPLMEEAMACCAKIDESTQNTNESIQASFLLRILDGI